MAKLTQSKRNHLSSSQFGRPGRGEGPSGKGRGSFPMNDPTHQRAAISGAARSYNAGNISKGTEEQIQSKARRLLGDKSDGGKGAQPQFKGAAKAAHRGQESEYDNRMSKSKTGGGVPNVDMGSGGSKPAAGAVPSKGTQHGGNRTGGGASSHMGVDHEAAHGGNGLIKAMHAHADKVHPC